MHASHTRTSVDGSTLHQPSGHSCYQLAPHLLVAGFFILGEANKLSQLRVFDMNNLYVVVWIWTYLMTTFESTNRKHHCVNSQHEQTLDFQNFLSWTCTNVHDKLRGCWFGLAGVPWTSLNLSTYDSCKKLQNQLVWLYGVHAKSCQNHSKSTAS